LAISVKRQKRTDNLLLKDRKKRKRNNEQPAHKTAHLQAPTHEPTLKKPKEPFFANARTNRQTEKSKFDEY